MSVDRILLTNDDGIDTVGFRAVYDALADDYDVVAVAPAEDQSAVGRALSNDVTVHQHELGYAVDGTPADCVVAGLGELVPDAEMVVSGCNRGANLGSYVLGRSGTVSAAVEAAFFDVPAIAASLYVPGGKNWRDRDVAPDDYIHAVRGTRYLVDHALDAGVFEAADYLNLNAPLADGEAGPAPDESASMAVTTPSTRYEMTAERDGDGVTLHDGIWERMHREDFDEPAGTDRAAIVDGKLSVSPLTAPHTVHRAESLAGLAEAYAETTSPRPKR